MSDCAHRQRAIRTRTDTQPDVGLLPGAVRFGIDHRDPRAAPPSVGDACGLGEPGAGRIMSPQHDGVGSVIVGDTDAASVSQGVGVVLVPAADFDRVDQIWTAEAADEALDPFEAIHHRRATRRGDREGDCFGAGCLSDVAELLGDLVKRLVPGDFAPAGVGGISRRSSAQWFGQAARAVHHLRRGPTLRT